MKISMPVGFFLIVLVGIFLFFAPVEAGGGVVINEVKISGGSGKSTDEFVELYNTGSDKFDLTNWKLYKYTKLSTSTADRILISNFSSAIIPALGYFLVGNINYVSSTSTDSADITYSDASLASDNTVLLCRENEEVVDMVGYGNATAFEGLGPAPDPLTHSIERTNFVDTNNNATDFVVSTPSPRNKSFVLAPVETPTATPTSTPDIQNLTPTMTPPLKINEFVPNPNSGEEWIEIYNPSTSTADLTDWKLFDAIGEIATPTGTVEAGGFFVVELSSSKLNNTGGDSVILKDTTDTVIDIVSYSEVAKGNSIARNVDGAGSFAETTTPTKNAANQINAPVQPIQSNGSGGGGPSTGSGQGGGSSSPQTQPAVSYQVGSVVINEIVSDPADDADEFIELFNNSNVVIDLRQWWLEDGSEARTNLDGQILSRGFFVANNPAGNLNNSGDAVILFDPSGKTIDQLTFGNWNDGSLNDNAPTAEDPLSLARKIDGRDTDNDYYDFALTGQITKGGANKIVSITPQGEKLSEAIVVSSQIILNEVFPNPKGSDTAEEFIELRNLGDSQVDLTGWQMSDASEKKYKINQGIVPAGGYIAFKRSLTGIALNNSGQEEVKLYNQNGALVDKIKYEGAVAEDQSYARRDDGVWAWTTKLTPGQANIIVGKSAAPVIALEFNQEASLNEEIIFDASDTTDPEGDKIKFSWDFGDGQKGEGDVVKHTYSKIGEYSVKLTVLDSASNAAEKTVKVMVEMDYVGGWIDLASQIIISEILPNPVGSDSAEFVELYNPTDVAMDLSGYKLDDEDGGSRLYVLPTGTIIEPLGFLLLERDKTGLALNNSNDAVRILDQDNNAIVEVDYDDVREGESYAFDALSGEWLWTAEITPGDSNIIASIVIDTQIAGITNTTNSLVKKEKKTIETTLDELRDNDVGDRVKFTGIVAVQPGILSSQYFYAVSDDASVGAQVYMNKKDFPMLAVGDLIEVTGEISSAYGETRVKTSVRDDIKLLKQADLPVPQEIEIASVGEEFEGGLLKIKGEITELKSSYMYVDDGTDELRVYFKKGASIDRKVFRVGDTVEAVGLLGSTRSGFQLLPREQSDIDIVSVLEEDTEVLSVGIGGPENMAETYLTVTAGGLTSIFIGLFARARGAMMFGLVKRVGKLAWVIIRRTPRV